MTQFKKICAGLMLALTTTSTTFAGGILTNTNQSIDFLRNPAREAAIGLDGVYSNPAGVVFMDEGFHFSVNWQLVKQTRTVETQNMLLAYGAKNNGQGVKTYEGKAFAPFVPSVQAAYNKKKWSFQFNFGIVGGGGKCTFDNGLGSFETAIGGVGNTLNATAETLRSLGMTGVPGVTGYDADCYMQGRNYYYGFTLGAAYKITKNLSAYVGARAIYATGSYKVNVDNIRVLSEDNKSYTLPEYVQAMSDGFQDPVGQATAVQNLTMLYMSKGMDMATAMQTAVSTLTQTGEELTASAVQLAPYYNGVKLQSDQTGFGIAPILGIDYKIANFNFAAKYEFKTHLLLKNKSTVTEASVIPAVNQYRDGTKVHEDMPALLTVGAQWSIIPSVRVNVGYHHYFDTDAKKTYCYADADGNTVTADNKNSMLKYGSNEYLGGVEWDPIKKLTVSTGFQITRYGLTDEYMSDMSFVTNSWSFGFGAKYQFNKHVAAQVAYFQTNYGHYKTAETIDSKGNPVSNDFTRTNNVFGAGIEVTF